MRMAEEEEMSMTPVVFNEAAPLSNSIPVDSFPRNKEDLTSIGFKKMTFLVTAEEALPKVTDPWNDDTELSLIMNEPCSILTFPLILMF